MGAAPLNCQAGVDEAGLGPLVGPLVVAGVALRPPRGGEAWQLLADVVCREPYEKGKIQVADSKKVHAGKDAFERLELTWDPLESTCRHASLSIL